jgi:uncharacterized delta-60 repeat protein
LPAPVRPHGPRLAAVIVLCLLALPAAATAAGRGDLDPTFSGDGRVTTPGVNPYTTVADAAVQPDGKIVVVGDTSTAFPDGNDLLVARYLPDGTLDPSFSGDGLQTTDVNGFYDGAMGVAIAPDGKILVSGFAASESGTSTTEQAVVRYLPDGTLDDSFAGDGKQTIGPGRGAAGAVAVQPDGKILLGGYDYPETGPVTFAVTRLTDDGTPDASFSGDGKLTTEFPGNSQIRALALEKDGKIVAAGRTDQGAVAVDYALARYTADGELDDTFSEDGRQTTDFGVDPGFDELYGVAIQDDGKIVASGVAGGETFGSRFGVVRYDTDGEPDPTFSEDGRQLVDFDGDKQPPDVYGYSAFGLGGVAVESDGTIVAAGSSTLINDIFEQESDFAVAALTPAGELDTRFSGDGKATADFGLATNSQAQAVAVTSDDRIVLAGTATTRDETQIALARFYGQDPPAPVPTPSPTTAPPAPGPAPTDPACDAARTALSAVSARASATEKKSTRASRKLRSARRHLRRAKHPTQKARHAVIRAKRAHTKARKSLRRVRAQRLAAARKVRQEC